MQNDIQFEFTQPSRTMFPLDNCLDNNGTNDHLSDISSDIFEEIGFLENIMITMRDGASTSGPPRQHRQLQSVGWSCEKVAISSETKCLPRSARLVWQRSNHRVAVACEAIPSSGESADEDALRRHHEPGRPRGPSRGTGALAEVTG
jgi:hypothetical protein